MKKILLICFTCIMLTGCSSTIGKKDISTKIHDLETANVANDYSLIFQQYDLSTVSAAKLYDEQLPVEEYNKKLAIIITNGMENIYTVANNRINQDMENLYQYSDSYIEHVAYLSTYVDFYNQDIDKIKEYLKSGNIDELKKLDSYKYADMMLIDALRLISK